MTRDFAAVITALSKERGVVTARMFGSQALKFESRVFAMVVKGDLVVKLSPERARTLVDEKQAGSFDPGHGRVMKQWVAIDPRSQLDWCNVAREALAYART